MTNKYIFYPGCSIQKNSRAYLDSMLEVQQPLDMQVQEIPDWNCCGATEYAAVHRTASYALVGRNLALAEQMKDGADTVVAACSACYLNLAKTDKYLRNDQKLNEQVNMALAAGGLHYNAGSVQIRHLLDVIVNDIGLEKIKKSVVKPLKGLRIAAYYGCMIVRPDPDKRWDSPEYPMALDKLMRALGAEVIDFPLKTHCCGGHMTQINPDTAYELIRRLVHSATEYKADMLVTLCPMCQLNLDAYQVEMNKALHTNYNMPILFFTQMMGIAFGKDPAALGFGKEFVNAAPALAKIGVAVPAGGEPPAAKAKKPEGLPMPQMPSQD